MKLVPWLSLIAVIVSPSIPMFVAHLDPDPAKAVSASPFVANATAQHLGSRSRQGLRLSSAQAGPCGMPPRSAKRAESHHSPDSSKGGGETA